MWAVKPFEYYTAEADAVWGKTRMTSAAVSMWLNVQHPGMPFNKFPFLFRLCLLAWPLAPVNRIVLPALRP